MATETTTSREATVDELKDKLHAANMELANLRAVQRLEESTQDFVKRHGADQIEVTKLDGVQRWQRGHLLFSNGARLLTRDGLSDRRYEPPENLHARLTLRLAYWQERLARALNAANRYAQDINEQVVLSKKYRNYEGQISPQVLDEAARLRKAAWLAHDKIAEIRKELATTPQAQAAAARDKELAEMDAHNAGILNQVMGQLNMKP